MSIPDGFDPEARAASIEAATKRHKAIERDTAKLLAYAKRAGWGPQVGLPTFQGNTMVYHFESGRRGYVQLPIGTEFE